MAATSSPNNTKTSLLTRLKKMYPGLTFEAAKQFAWSPKNRTVSYNKVEINRGDGVWALLHEVGHGLLGHQQFTSDAQLLMYEAAAWQKAVEIAHQFDITIPTEHIDECLNTYRDWLYARSTCSNCQVNGLQIDQRTYKCINCSHTWEVSASRFCRPYRMNHILKTT